MGLFSYIKRFLGVTERYERDGSVITVSYSRRTFSDDTYAVWLLRNRLDPSKHLGLAALYWSQYLQDKHGRGYTTPEEEADYQKSR